MNVVSETPARAEAPGAKRSIPANPQALLQAVLDANQGTRDPRTRLVLDARIGHLHALAAEVTLTYEELFKGMEFIVRVGQATGPLKHEGIPLADILGLATLVLLMDAKAVFASGGTEPAPIGPFWRANQPAPQRRTHRECGHGRCGTACGRSRGVAGRLPPSPAHVWTPGRRHPAVCTRTRTCTRRT